MAAWFLALWGTHSKNKLNGNLFCQVKLVTRFSLFGPCWSKMTLTSISTRNTMADLLIMGNLPHRMVEPCFVDLVITRNQKRNIDLVTQAIWNKIGLTVDKLQTFQEITTMPLPLMNISDVQYIINLHMLSTFYYINEIGTKSITDRLLIMGHLPPEYENDRNLHFLWLRAISS